jgi:hypothetical protein
MALMASTSSHRTGRTPTKGLRSGVNSLDYRGTLKGLAALPLDALHSIAYAPEAKALVLVAADVGEVRVTLPLTIAITLLLAVLVVGFSLNQ